jgi:prophage DNA circulation protein
MTWRDQLREGSFRGVPFKFESHDMVVGRRTAVHEYPGRDDPYVEDLGAITGEFSLELFVIGPNYMAARDALIKALNTKGPGELIHPYVGKKTVAVTDGRLSESADEGGMARFSVTFTSTTEPEYPSEITNTGAVVAGRVTAARAAIEQSFGQRVMGYLKGAADFVQQATGVLSGGLVNTVLDYARQYAPVGDILGTVNSLKQVGQSVVSLVSNPLGWASGTSSLFSGFGGIAQGLFDQGGTTPPSASPTQTQQQKRAQSAYKAVAGWGDTLTPSTPGALAAVINVTATTAMTDTAVSAIQSTVASGLPVAMPSLLVAPGIPLTDQGARALGIAAEIAAFGRRQSLIEEASASAVMVFESYGDAIAYRNDLTDRIQAEAEISDDTVCRALLDLRQAVSADIGSRAINLVRLAYFTPTANLPTAVLAYRLYGDGERADEIVQHNHIVHPGFCGQDPLEVLSA